MSTASCASGRPDVTAAFGKLHEPDRAELSSAALALKQSPQDPDLHLTFVGRCLRAGTEVMCRDFYTQHIPGTSGPALLSLAFGDAAPVQQRLTAAQAEQADGPQLRFVLASTLARHYAARGKLSEAEATLLIVDETAAAAHREMERLLSHTAVAIERRDFQQARTWIQQVVDAQDPLSTEQRELVVRLGQRLAERSSLGDDAATDTARRLLANLPKLSPDEIVADAEVAVSRFSESSLVWTAVGLARLKAGNEVGGLIALERSRELGMFDPEADWQLAKFHERRQRYASAVFHLRRALETSPTFNQGLWRLGDVALMARDLSAAELAMRRLKRLYPEELKVDLGRARVLLEGEDALRALAVLKDATRHYPTDIRAPLALAKAALTLRERATTPGQRKDMFGEAERAYTLAKELDEQHGEVQALEKALGALRGAP